MISQNNQKNDFLRSISPEDYDALMRDAERADMPVGLLLRAGENFQTSFIYFPESAICAVESQFSDRRFIQLGVFGADSFAGASSGVGELTAHLWTRTIIAGSAIRVPTESFNAQKKKSSPLRDSLSFVALRHLKNLTIETCCMYRCNDAARFADRIRKIHSLVERDTLGICGKVLGDQMGYGKSTTQRFVATLREIGAVSIGSDGLTVRDPAALNGASCGCAMIRESPQMDLSLTPPELFETQGSLTLN
jgi:hypothetical protein